MPIYEMECSECGWSEEQVASFEEVEKLEGYPCSVCGAPMRRLVGNRGGFRLGVDGSCAWADGGYGSTHGDIENFKAGRILYGKPKGKRLRTPKG